MKQQARTRSRGKGAARWTGGLLALAVLAWALPSQAARVLEVRVGRHPDFTRVVLELDTPAGYKIERSEPSPGVSELIVSLEASGTARRIAGGNRQIDFVKLEPAGPGRSTVHIRLARGGLRLKEMILAGPPRIVLDVLGGEPETRTAAKAAPVKPTAKPAPKPAAKPTPKPVAKTPAKPAPSAAPDLEPAATPSTPDVRRPLAEPVPVPAPKPGPTATPEPQAAVPAPSGNELDQAGAELEPESAAAEGAEPTRVAMAEPGRRSGTEGSVARPAPAPVARPAARPLPTPPARRPEPSAGGSLFSIQNMALAAGAVVLVAGGLMLVRRRRASSAGERADEEGLGEANPFEGFGESVSDEQSPMGDATETATYLDEDQASTGSEAFPSADSDEPSLFDVAVDQGAAQGADMQTAASGFETSGAETAVGDDVMRLIRELERRVTSLESRLDEAVDAKERLERQVAAQTEELRVQRAAIARTQRAVRNLSRPEDEGATEPARREV